jgi:hypothetical protein
LKATTFDGEYVADPPLAGWTTTCVAVIVVPLAVPRTRTGLPFLTALAEVGLVPLRYVVDDAFLTVTFCPADVDTVKLEVDTLLTVPTTPPAAGPERALDPAAGATIAGCAAVALAEPLLLEIAPAIPAAPPAMTTTAAPMARGLFSLCVNIE